MPPANQDRRNDVIGLAGQHGWTRDSARTKHGAISDEFTKGQSRLICFWSNTPWSEAKWESGLFLSPSEQRQVWRIAGNGGVLDLLKR